MAILLPVSLTLVANLPPVSLIPVVHLYSQISPRIFEKIRNGPNGILWGWGETDWWKKPEAKNLLTLSLYSHKHCVSREQQNTAVDKTWSNFMNVQFKCWLPWGLLYIKSRKLSNFSKIWRINVSLWSQSGEGGESSVVLFYCSNTLRLKCLTVPCPKLM